MCEHVYVALKMAGGFLLKARLLYFNTLVYSAEDSKVVFFIYVYVYFTQMKTGFGKINRGNQGGGWVAEGSTLSRTS